MRRDGAGLELSVSAGFRGGVKVHLGFRMDGTRNARADCSSADASGSLLRVLSRNSALCLAKLKSAFGINNIKKEMQQCCMPCGLAK
jgi:hypothetical protein